MYSDFGFLYPLLIVLNAAGGIALYLLRRTFAGKDEVKKVEAKLSELENRLSSLPSADSVNELKLEMSELRGDIRNVATNLNPFSHQLGLLLEQAVNRSHQ